MAQHYEVLLLKVGKACFVTVTARAFENDCCNNYTVEGIYTQQAVVITSNRNHYSEILAVTAAHTAIFLYLVCVLLYHMS